MKTCRVPSLGRAITSNYDHLVVDDVAAQLEKGELSATYPGRNFFCQHVWKDGDGWNAEVWVNHEHVETATEPTVADLVHTICEQYGYE